MAKRAAKIARLTPLGLDRIFFTNSGSEAIDTALKMALCYHHCRSDTERFRFIGRGRSLTLRRKAILSSFTDIPIRRIRPPVLRRWQHRISM